jgi:hypothetical protein
MPNAVKIPFRSRSIRPDTTTAELFRSFETETHVKLPSAIDFTEYDEDCTIHVGEWNAGRVLLVHNSQPPPKAGAQPNPAPAPGPAAPEKPVRYGVFAGSGVRFVSTRPIDCAKVSMDRMIAELNQAVPGLGNEVRFFVGTIEIDSTALVSGTPYSVYPRKIKRP